MERFAPLVAFLASDAFRDARAAAVEARDAMMSPETNMIYGMLAAHVNLMDSIAAQVRADVKTLTT